MSEIARSGTWNPGGGRWLEIVPSAFVSGYTPATGNVPPVITLLAGRSWTRIYTTEGTLMYRVSPDWTDNGRLYSVEIKGFSPNDSPDKGTAVDELFKLERFLVRFTDNTGLVRIAGTPVESLQFAPDFSTDADVGGSRGYSLSLKGTLTQRPAYA